MSGAPQPFTLHWELANEAHVTRHGVSRRQIEDMVSLTLWVMLPDPNGGPDRWRVIGPTDLGRWITLVVRVLTSPSDYVPVTCWPSTEQERSLYWRKFR